MDATGVPQQCRCTSGVTRLGLHGEYLRGECGEAELAMDNWAAGVVRLCFTVHSVYIRLRAWGILGISRSTPVLVPLD